MATEATKIPFVEAAAPSTPAASRVVVYAKSDGLMYSKDDAGAETLMSGGSAGVPAGAITASGLTMATARILGRTTASTGAIEEITVGSGLSLSAGSLTATGAALESAVSRQTSGTDYSITSATYADIDATNLSLTITTGAHRVKVTFTCALQHGSTASTNNFDVLVDGTGLGGNGAWQYRPVRTNEYQAWTWVYVTAALTAASHTFKLQWKSSTGTMTLNRASFPCIYIVEEMAI